MAATVTVTASYTTSGGTILSSGQAPSLLPLCRASQWCSGMVVSRPAGLVAQPMRPLADPTSLHQAPVSLLGWASAESGRSPPVEVRRIDSIGSLDRGSDRCAGSPGPPTRQAVPPRVMRRGRGLGTILVAKDGRRSYWRSIRDRRGVPEDSCNRRYLRTASCVDWRWSTFARCQAVPPLTRPRPRTTPPSSRCGTLKQTWRAPTRDPKPVRISVGWLLAIPASAASMRLSMNASSRPGQHRP